MPSNVNPKDIKIGSGKTVPDHSTPLQLLNGQTVGQGSTGGDAGLVLQALKAHINDPRGAHAASSISVDPNPPLTSNTLEGSLQELAAVTPYEPPKLGQFFEYSDFCGIPDWGILKLNDASLSLRDSAFTSRTLVNPADQVYPYYLAEPSPASQFGVYQRTGYYDKKATAFVAGADPLADKYWNYPTLGVPSGTDPMGGPGLMYAGGYTRADGTVQRTTQLIKWDASAKWPKRVGISGSVYPADRGVLALLHFPPNMTNISDFLSMPLLERCVAAILLGQGILGDGCISIGSDGVPCDGEPGGIFSSGTDANGDYDPFRYPGRATGQYSLWEIHQGISALDGNPLPAPWSSPSRILKGGVFPAPGQVRLGIDPEAGELPDPNGWGIPVLGAPAASYDNAVLLPNLSHYAWNHYFWGRSDLDVTNAFHYRLPYLTDYSDTTGLKYTSSGFRRTVTRETFRSFKVAGMPDGDAMIGSPLDDPYSWDSYSPPQSIAQAGHYPDFSQDDWNWQVAKFRHTFLVAPVAVNDPPVDPPTPTFAPGSPKTVDIGTYLLVHFKSEKDFELLTHSGIMPAKVYGYSVLQDVGTGTVDLYSNLVNIASTFGQDFPFGPAPDYGFVGPSYHNLRASVYFGGDATDQTITAGDVTTAVFNYSALDTMYMSGIQYYLPRDSSGNAAFKISEAFVVPALSLSVDNAWRGGYCTDDNWGATMPSSAPAVLSSPNPAFISLAPFAYDYIPGTGTPTFVLPAGLTDLNGARYQRIEFPFNVVNAGAFDDVAGPAVSDVLSVLTHGDIEFLGDHTNPACSTKAYPRAFIRRPLAHDTWKTALQPAYDDSNPVVDGHGHRIAEGISASNILYHSTSFTLNDTVASGLFGNFVDVAPTYSTFASLYTSGKSSQERFLDETYRYISATTGLTVPALALTAVDALLGPGLGAWGPLYPIATPVTIGLNAANIFDHGVDTTWAWSNFSWMATNRYHLNDLTVAPVPGAYDVRGELQVAGLPDRNPPLSDWVKVPFPSAGLLRYPAVDYSAYNPSGSDYSAATGTRSYMRVFDAAFSKTVEPYPSAAGQPFVVFRVDGLTLSDFAYTAPGPGTLNAWSAPKIAIMVKVPGLTTWMDLGRQDNTGPSKQDVLLDGAGCKVVGPHTFDSVDNDTGMVYCQVKVNVGPTANLVDGQQVTGDYEVPIMTKIVMNAMAADIYDLVTDVMSGQTGPGVPSANVRGIVGLRVVHPNHVETV